MNDEQKAFATEQLKRQIARAPSRRECAWFELKRGTDPSWIAHKYGYPAETMREARAKLDAEAKAKQKQAAA